MRPSHRSLLRAALIILISAALLIAAAGPILSHLLNKEVKARLEASHIYFNSLSVNLFTRSITIEKLNWEDNASVKNVYAGGIRLLPLIRDKKISLRKLSFADGSVSMRLDKIQSGGSIDIKALDIDRIIFDNIDVKLMADTATEYSANVGLTVHYFAIDSSMSYTFRNIEVAVKDFEIHNETSLATFKIKSATFNRELMKLHIDSLELEPLLNKNDFAKKVKSQQTRTTLAITSVDAAGVNMGVHMNDSTIMVSSITINGPMIHAYKNKKYPFTRKTKFPLPMESFRSLGIGVEVDTIKIHEGTITYEELPTEGFNTSWITFEGVEATMQNLNNRDFKNLSGYATVDASAHVMKTGQIKATFKVPLGDRKRYSAEGTVTNVPLRELNPLLKDLAFIEMASGKLNRMDFVFTYDDVGSKGQLHFDYEGLKILGLKKEREKDVNTFKTLLLNTAVKNDETLTGDIDVIRDQRKAVFNLWARSIADGISNALMPRRKEKRDKEK